MFAGFCVRFIYLFFFSGVLVLCFKRTCIIQNWCLWRSYWNLPYLNIIILKIFSCAERTYMWKQEFIVSLTEIWIITSKYGSKQLSSPTVIMPGLIIQKQYGTASLGVIPLKLLFRMIRQEDSWISSLLLLWSFWSPPRYQTGEQQCYWKLLEEVLASRLYSGRSLATYSPPNLCAPAAVLMLPWNVFCQAVIARKGGGKYIIPLEASRNCCATKKIWFCIVSLVELATFSQVGFADEQL